MIQFMVKCVAKEPEKKQEAFLSKQQELPILSKIFRRDTRVGLKRK